MLLASAPAASAHLRSGTVAVDYRVSITDRVTPAYSAQIYQSDHGLRLTVRPGHVVIVLGYLREPVFRLDRAGLWVNAASATAVALHLLSKAKAVESTTPKWRLAPGQRSVVWHDARTQGLPVGVDRGIWSVPLVVDGRGERLTGELERFPRPSLWLWLGALAAWLAAGAWPLVLHRRGLARSAAFGFAVVGAGAAAVAAMALALDSYASPGTWIVGLDAIALLVAGLAVLCNGPANLHVAAAIGVGLVSMAVGLLDGAVFLHPIVLAVISGALMRVAVVTAIGAGLNAAVLGSLFFSEIAGAVRDSGWETGSAVPVGIRVRGAR